MHRLTWPSFIAGWEKRFFGFDDRFVKHTGKKQIEPLLKFFVNKKNYTNFELLPSELNFSEVTKQKVLSSAVTVWAVL